MRSRRFRGDGCDPTWIRAFRRRVVGGALLALLLAVFKVPPARSSPQVAVPLIIPEGVPLRITLENRVPINHPGVRVEGRLTAPVYVYDRVVLPAGSEVLGRVVEVRGASRLTRARAIMNGNFTPLRTATVEFDTLELSDGKRLAISTVVQPGAAQTIELVSGGDKKKSRIKDPASGVIASERQQLSAEKEALLSTIRQPDKIRRAEAKLKELVVAELPYHRQAFQPGTVFTADLESPLAFGVASLPEAETTRVGSPPPPDSTIHARLVTPLDSATARPGTPVQAVVTQPLFSSKHELIVPEGTRLEGTVMRAKPARRLHRNGKLRFTFQRLEPPAVKSETKPSAAQPEIIHASVERIEVDRASHLKLDAEGGAEPVPSRKKYIAPAISVLLALQAATPDNDAYRDRGISAASAPSQGGAVGQILSGGWGLGLVGSVVALAGGSRILTATLGFYGAALSVYSNLLARGQNVSFPENTPMDIELGSHARRVSKLPLPALHLPGIPRG